MRTCLPVIAIASVVAIAGAVAAPATDTGPAREDPFVWLEQVDGERAMAWVRVEDAKTAVLEQDARYAGLFKEALELAEAKDRIPEPQLIGGRILNRWQDADHVRGIWRRTSLAEALIWSTTKDDRVGPQHARKFAARLAAMGVPYLFYEVVQGGHGSGATLAERAAMTAREFTYFWRKLAPPENPR